MTITGDTDDQQNLHATAVAINGAGVMILGKSGSGKSDLALRLIDRGALLVSDDYVDITRVDQNLLLSPPASIAGKLEVRSLGILKYDHISRIALKLIVNLKETPDRFPIDKQAAILLGIEVPSCTLNAMEASATIKVELALQKVLQDSVDI
ncbi:HPr kinase/phosphorylase [Parasphingorhabdus sp.]|uniref:HPr kinase/phosphorylase n=1 Tax=Parasphingorhabdus sp. TaxID=2709688 RepID=UPI003A94BB0F